MFRNKRPKAPWLCAKCGSHNVELRSSWPDGPVLEKLRDLLSGDTFPQGQNYLICNDCGHVSIIHIL